MLIKIEYYYYDKSAVSLTACGLEGASLLYALSYSLRSEESYLTLTLAFSKPFIDFLSFGCTEWGYCNIAFLTEFIFFVKFTLHVLGQIVF